MKWLKQIGTSENVTYQEPPYDGPYAYPPFDPNVFATLENSYTPEVRWCERCNRPVVIGDQPRHPHFDVEDSVELGP